MKGRDALAYCRQLLFEQRLIGVWVNNERMRLVAAIERWRAFPEGEEFRTMAGLASRWQEELQRERVSSLERGQRDARALERTRARLEAAEGVVVQLRQDNNQMREELGQVRGLQELSGELEQLRTERSARVAAGARAVLQEKALRRQLEAEERRLSDGASQLASLEAMAKEDEAGLRMRQAAEERVARTASEDAKAELRAASGKSFDARLAWFAAFAYARLVAAWARHERQLEELDERLVMLNALRESRDALEWRVTQTKAALIVLRSGSELDPSATRGEVRVDTPSDDDLSVFSDVEPRRMWNDDQDVASVS